MRREKPPMAMKHLEPRPQGKVDRKKHRLRGQSREVEDREQRVRPLVPVVVEVEMCAVAAANPTARECGTSCWRLLPV